MKKQLNQLGKQNAGWTNNKVLTLSEVVTIIYEPPYDKNQQNGMCAQPRLRSALASAQSDQSLCCLHEESLGP